MVSPIISVLRNSPFRHLWLAQIFSQIAVNMLTFVLTFRVYSETRSNTAVSLLVLSIGLPALLFGSLAGVYVDRWEKRRVLLWCNIFRGLLLLIFFFFRDSLPLVYLIAVSVGIITQFFIPAEGPLIPRLVPVAQLLSANSLFSFTFYGSMAMGFVLSGPLLVTFGPDGTFLLMSSLFFLAAIFSFFLPQEARHKFDYHGVPFSTFIVELREGFTYLRQNRVVMEAILLFTASWAFMTTIAALAPGFADRVLLIDLTDTSILVMGPTIVGLIAASLFLGFVAGKYSARKIVNTGIAGVGATLLILSLFIRIGNRPDLVARMEKILPPHVQVERLDVAMVLFFLLGAANAAIIVPLNAIIQKETIDKIRGRVYGVLSASTGGVSILPVIGAGTFADRIGVGKTIFGLSLFVLSFAAYRIWRSR